MNAVIAILASIACSVCGQISLKSGMNRVGRLGEGGPVHWKRGLPRIVLGLGVYGVSALLWLYVLSRSDLSFAFPFLSLSFVAILLGARWGLGEPFEKTRLIGSAIIVAGVLVVGTSFTNPTAGPTAHRRGVHAWVDEGRPVLLLLRDEWGQDGEPVERDPSAEWTNLLVQRFGSCDVQPLSRLQSDADSLLQGRELLVLPRRVLEQLDPDIRGILDPRLDSGALTVVAEAPGAAWAHSLGLRIATVEARSRLPWPLPPTRERLDAPDLLVPRRQLEVPWTVWRYAPDPSVHPYARPVVDLAGRPGVWNQPQGRGAWVVLALDLGELGWRMHQVEDPELKLPWWDAWAALVLGPEAAPLPWPRLEPRSPDATIAVRDSVASPPYAPTSALPFRPLGSHGGLLSPWILSPSAGLLWSDWNEAGLAGPVATSDTTSAVMSRGDFDRWWTARQHRRWRWTWEDPWLSLNFEAAASDSLALSVELPRRWHRRAMDDWSSATAGVGSSSAWCFGQATVRFTVPARATELRVHYATP